VVMTTSRHRPTPADHGAWSAAQNRLDTAGERRGRLVVVAAAVVVVVVVAVVVVEGALSPPVKASPDTWKWMRRCLVPMRCGAASAMLSSVWMAELLTCGLFCIEVLFVCDVCVCCIHGIDAVG
jgi:hypothetical protein